MTGEQDFQAHYRCTHCHAVRPKGEIIFCDDKPICRDNDNCKEMYYAATKPRAVPRSVGYYDKG